MSNYDPKAARPQTAVHAHAGRTRDKCHLSGPRYARQKSYTVQRFILKRAVEISTLLGFWHGSVFWNRR